MGFTLKQRRFIDVYSGNAKEAAVIAGYSAKTANIQGFNLLRNPKIKEAIDKRLKEEQDALIATRQERQRFWTEVIRDPSIKLLDRLKAAELLGKSQCDFVERVEMDVDVDGRYGVVVLPASDLDGDPDA